MKIISAEVQGERITKLDGIYDLIAGSRGYLHVQLESDSAWNGCVKIAVFTYDDIEEAVVMENNLCPVPDIICDQRIFYLQFVGVRKGGYRVNSAKRKITQGGSL